MKHEETFVADLNKATATITNYRKTALTREDLKAVILAALKEDKASYIHLHAAAAMLTDGGDNDE